MKINNFLVQALSTEKSSEPERAEQEKAGGVRAGYPCLGKGAGKDFLPRYGAKPRTESGPLGPFFSFVGDLEWRVRFASLDEGTQRLSSLVHIE